MIREVRRDALAGIRILILHFARAIGEVWG
jgi:hypothetical protein